MLKDDLEKFIENNLEEFDTEAPPAFVLDRILEEMQPEKKPKPAGILISYRAIRWAAAGLVLVCCGIAVLIMQHRQSHTTAMVKTRGPAQQHNTVAEPQATGTPAQSGLAVVDHDLSQRKRALLASLPTRPPGSQRQVVFANLHDQESPASRIAAADAVERLPNKGNDVVDALVQTLNSDPNSNVRLAALDGLAKFYQEAYVRKHLVNALKKQSDPVVQIAMINLLIRMRESGILEELDKLVNDENTQKAVKDCAYSGILQLRSS